MSAPEPFRVAFLLAALTAARAIGPWFGDPATHADELIFGFLVLQLFGFLLVALPRWIGRPLGPAPAIWLVLAAQGAAFLLGFHDLELAGRLRSLIGLAGVALLLANTPAGKTAATFPVLLLAGLHAGLGVGRYTFDWAGSTMAGMALILLICLEVSNRVGAALVAVARERAGRPPRPALPGWLRLAERASAALALVLFGLDGPAGLPALIAGLLGGHWLWHQRVWQIKPYAGVVIMVVGMVWKRVGLLLLAAWSFGVGDVPQLAVIHVLTIGGLATLAIGIATSIVRKREKRSLTPSGLANLTYAAIIAAMAARVGGALVPDWHDGLVMTGRWLWLTAFTGYFAFVIAHAFRPLAKPVELPHLHEP